MATLATSQSGEISADKPIRRGFVPRALASHLQATPLLLILGFFFVLPILTIVVVSFWDYDFAGLYPDFLTMNYADTLG